MPTVQGNSSSASPNNIGAYNNTANDLTGTSTASLASGYPTGFNAFYAMKYEISQQQYVDFLNTLTFTQQAARTIVAPNSAAGTPALIAGNANRNGIDIQTPGTSATVPAVYACNLNGNSTYNESEDGQHIACNYLSWDDLIAYLDWAALRPMTELEYEKSCRGNQNPTANEFAWGNTSATALSGLSNASTMSEAASNTSSNIAYNNAFTSGPVRAGIFATSSSTRATSGAGYYGNMELSGNLWERVVTLGNATGRTFSGVHGNGTLTSGGAANVSGWPTAAGAGLKGGGFESNNLNASISGRASAASGDNSRQSDFGGRGARSSSTGIVTDGLVLWLDAAIPASYPTAGTTWTDLSGNNNNGTLSNGPTFNSTNGGSIVFDGVNDHTDLGSNFTYPIFTISLWVNAGSTQVQYADIIDNNHTGFRNFVLQQNNNNTNQYAFGVSDASGGISSSGSINLTANTWTNISITFTPSDRVIAYVNGTFHSQGALANNRNILYQAQVLRLAAWAAGGRNWNGRIASFISYNRVLSSAEILQNFNAQKALFGL
jgi:formylglycine-generating enzyme required for sulfatase activity